MIQIQQQVSLLPLNTMGVAAMANHWVVADNSKDICDLIKSLSNSESPVILGGGSNVLFASDVYEWVIQPQILGIEILGEDNDSVLVRAGAGENWDHFTAWCASSGYSGVENLSLIPGTVGACPIQNIGAYGAEVKDVIETVETCEIATGRSVLFNSEQCDFGYRDSYFKRHKGQYLVEAVQFRLSKQLIPNIGYADVVTEIGTDTVTIDRVRQAIINIRNRKLPDPVVIPNAGSFFKNPVVSNEKAAELKARYPDMPQYPLECGYKLSAAWLIQTCGWKGVRHGQVGTHVKQPLVVVNYGGATGKEIFAFAQEIIASVREQMGITFDIEVNVC